jgi:hypothetical protein
MGCRHGFFLTQINFLAKYSHASTQKALLLPTQMALVRQTSK